MIENFALWLWYNKTSIHLPLTKSLSLGALFFLITNRTKHGADACIRPSDKKKKKKTSKLHISISFSNTAKTSTTLRQHKQCGAFKSAARDASGCAHKRAETLCRAPVAALKMGHCRLQRWQSTGGEKKKKIESAKHCSSKKVLLLLCSCLSGDKHWILWPGKGSANTSPPVTHLQPCCLQ